MIDRHREEWGPSRLVDRLARRGPAIALHALRQGAPAERWTAAGLADHARRLAAGLRSRGLQPGDHVVLMGASSPRWIATCLGVLHAGGVVVPIDAQFPDEILDAVLADCGAGWIAVDQRAAERIERLDHGAGMTRILLADDEGEHAWPRFLAAAGLPGEARSGDDRAALFYTSGTTGTPKGVPLSQRNLAYQVEVIERLGVLRADDVVLLPLPLHHVYPFVIGTLVPLALGVPLVLPAALTGPAVLEAVREGGVSAIVGVPRLYRALVQGLDARVTALAWPLGPLIGALLRLALWSRRRLGLRLGKLLLRPLHRQLGSRLRLMASGGSPLDPELGWRLEGLGWRVAIGYGLTETSPLLSLSRPGDGRLETAGRVVPGTEVRIDTTALDAGEPDHGEVQARGPGVFAAYHQRPDDSAAAFTDDGWYRTGDIGVLGADGYLRLAGRLSTMLVTAGGENIQPEALEEAYEQEAAIREIGVLQRGDDLVAVVVPDRGAIARGEAGGEAEVPRAVAAALDRRGRRLPSYQRLADHRLSATPLPRTRLGKIRRQALEEAWDRAAEDGDAARRTGPVPLEELGSEDRELLADPQARAAWELLCERHPDKPVAPDALLGLDLGLDSLAWLDLGLALRARTGVELDETTIAELETVRDLLQAVARGEPGPGGGDPATPVREPWQHLTDQQRRYLLPLRGAAAGAAWLLGRINRRLMRRLLHLRVEGLEHLPRSGPCIIAPNHASLADPPALAAALDQHRLWRTWWIGFTGAAFGNPLTRLVSRMGRAVPIDPRGGAASSLAVGSLLLAHRRMLVVFPEGERSWDGGLRPFRPGVGLLLAEHRVPVIPVHIAGTHAVLPRGSARLRLRAVRVRFGRPLEHAELTADDDGRPPHEQVAQRLHAAVARLGSDSAAGFPAPEES